MAIGSSTKCLLTQIIFSTYPRPTPCVRLSPHTALHPYFSRTCDCCSTLITRASSLVPLLSLRLRMVMISHSTPLPHENDFHIPTFAAFDVPYQLWFIPLRCLLYSVANAYAYNIRKIGYICGISPILLAEDRLIDQDPFLSLSLSKRTFASSSVHFQVILAHSHHTVLTAYLLVSNPYRSFSVRGSSPFSVRNTFSICHPANVPYIHWINIRLGQITGDVSRRYPIIPIPRR